MKIEFIFDFASPNVYLANKVLPEFIKKHNVSFEYNVCLLGGIFKLSNNQPPLIAAQDIPNKTNYFMNEISRFVNFHKIEEFKMNPFFLVYTVMMQRGLIYASKQGNQEKYIEVVMRGMWEEEKNLGDHEILSNHLTSNGLNGAEIIEHAVDQEVKDELFANTENAVKRGVFGAPTFFIGEHMFFGKEAIREMPDYL